MPLGPCKTTCKANCNIEGAAETGHGLGRKCSHRPGPQAGAAGSAHDAASTPDRSAAPGTAQRGGHPPAAAAASPPACRRARRPAGPRLPFQAARATSRARRRACRATGRVPAVEGPAGGHAADRALRCGGAAAAHRRGGRLCRPGEPCCMYCNVLACTHNCSQEQRALMLLAAGWSSTSRSCRCIGCVPPCRALRPTHACLPLLATPQVGGSPGADTDETGAEESEADLSLSGPGQRRATPQQGEDSSWSRGLDARWGHGFVWVYPSMRACHRLIGSCSGLADEAGIQVAGMGRGRRTSWQAHHVRVRTACCPLYTATQGQAGGD